MSHLKKYNHFQTILYVMATFKGGHPSLKVNMPNERAHTGSYRWIITTICHTLSALIKLWCYCDLEGQGHDLN